MTELSTDLYNVTITGFLPNVDRSAAKDQLGKLFSASQTQVEKICASLPFTVKRKVDHATATQYQAALNRLGFKCSNQVEHLAVDLPSESEIGQNLESAAPKEAELGTSQVADKSPSKPSRREMVNTVLTGIIAVAVLGGVAIRGYSYLSEKYFGSSTSSAPGGAEASARSTAPTQPLVATISPTQPLSAEEKQIVEKIRAASKTGGLETTVELFDGVQLLRITDQYGEKATCQAHFAASKASDSSALPPKWAMTYFTGAGINGGLVTVESFFGTQTPLRMHFDDAASFLEMSVTSGGNAVAPVHGKWREALINSKKLVIDHGQGGKERIAFQYDLSRFPSALRIATAVCPTT